MNSNKSIPCKSDHLCLPNRCRCDYGKPPEVPFQRMAEFCGINHEEEKKLASIDNERANRMFNGMVINNSTLWPFIVQIFEKPEKAAYLCGGAILSPDYIISAAHCFYFTSHNEDEIIVSVYDTVYVTTLFIPSRTIYIHNEYKANNNHAADIAVIRLLRSIEINYEHRPICLFSSEMEEDSLDFIGFSGMLVTVNGGEGMKSASFEIKESDKCQNSDTVCAVSSSTSDENINTCKGDSGSPLIPAANAECNQHIFHCNTAL